MTYFHLNKEYKIGRTVYEAKKSYRITRDIMPTVLVLQSSGIAILTVSPVDFTEAKQEISSKPYVSKKKGQIDSDMGEVLP